MPTQKNQKLVFVKIFKVLYQSMHFNLMWNGKNKEQESCVRFDMFVFFHLPESLDLYGVKSGILPSETKRKNWKVNQHEKQKTHSYACQSYFVSTGSIGKAI